MRASHLLGDLLTKVTDIGRALTAGEDTGVSICDRCEALVSRHGEATGLALGREILDRYKHFDRDEKKVFFHEIIQRFGVDESGLSESIHAWQQNPGHDAARQIHFASEPRSQELIRRLNRAPGATRDLVSMRKDLLEAIKLDSSLKQLDKDFSHLFNSWFNRGFLELRRIDWDNTPARILEKVITYEAVHEINGWDELRLRVAAEDRRLYAFFHPALNGEPLIFVEVALTEDMPRAIDPILASQREPLNPRLASTAVFYSISNCQAGLRGVSFGNFLIKQVVEELRREFSALQNFVTLSPVPAMRRWVVAQIEAGESSPLSTKLNVIVESLGGSQVLKDGAVDQQALPALTALYLLEAKADRDGPLDPVARFHLGNGACLERINIGADSSSRGSSNSWGVMVNYLYDLDSIERNHEAYANQGKVICSNQVRRLLK